MSKINEWLEDDKLILLEGWARQGLTEEQIAKNMGISVKTLYNWKNKELQILQALKKGKEVVDFEVENDIPSDLHITLVSRHTLIEKVLEDLAKISPLSFRYDEQSAKVYVSLKK